MALVLLHHAVTGVVDDGEGFTVGIRGGINLALVFIKDLFEVFVVDVLFLEDVSGSEPVFSDVLTEDIDIVLNFIEVCKALLYFVPVFCPTNGLVVEVSDYQALSNIRCKEVWFPGLLVVEFG